MKLPIFVRVPWLHVKAITLVFIVLWKYTYTSSGEQVGLTPDLVVHESIHFWQWLELLLVGFLPVYIWDFSRAYLWSEKAKNHPQGRFWGAYHRIRMEQEAFDNEKDEDYLSTRKWFAWSAYELY